MKNLIVLVVVSIYIFGPKLSYSAERVYNLTVGNKTVNFTGKKVTHAIAINGSIPAPTLEFVEGDTAIINVTNTLNEPTTLHWHGLLLPWDMDGPAFTNNKQIMPGEKFTFTFPIRQHGTYWYHSHTKLQEQRGLYGAIVIREKAPRFKVDKEIVMVMSDWIDEKPMKVLDNLKMDGEYYALKKKFDTSLWAAIKHGAVWDYIKGQWNRMGPMDLSDVAYDAFLINGKEKYTYGDIKQGETVKLRIINAGASSYFYVNIGNKRKFKVIAKDGQNVEPVEVQELLVGMAETYDIIFKLPKMKMMKHRYEVRATSQDIVGHASIFLSRGMEENVPDKMKPIAFGGMDHGDMDHGDMGDGGMDHGNMDHSKHGMVMNKEKPKDETKSEMPMIKRLDYSMLKATAKTSFDSKYIRNDITLELNGNMETYNWNINGKSFSEDKYIIIRENEVVRFKFVNNTMMHHPMHLHGHFFRALNGQGDFAPLFHTVDMAPMKTMTIEFLANEPGIWLLHCHNLYHMKMGMARIIKYEGFERPLELIKAEKSYESKESIFKDVYMDTEVAAFSNHAEVNVNVNKGKYRVEMKVELDDYDPETFEAEVVFKRAITKSLSVLAGTEYEHGEREAVGILGLAYNAPFNIEVTTSIKTDGTVEVSLEKEIPITNRLILSLEPSFEYKDEFLFKEEGSLMYRVHDQISIGLFQSYEQGEGFSIGAGVTIRF